MKRVLVSVLIVLSLGAALAPAEDIRVITPYVGGVFNSFERESSGQTLEGDGWGLMEGLFLQWLNPDLFLSNVFLYHSAEVNSARILGLHLIGDYYFLPRDWGKAVVGAGFELISVDTDAGDDFSDDFIFDFELPTTIYVPYVRVGHYVYLGSRDRVRISILPWAGVQYDVVRGDLSFTVDPPGPFPPPINVEADLDDEQWSGITGVNVGAVIMHFIDIQAKYRATINSDDFLSSFDGLLNFYFTRNWGISYRYKYSQGTAGDTSYHLGGVVYAF